MINLRTLLKKSGKRNCELARYLGVPTGTVARYVTGTRKIGGEVASRIARFTGAKHVLSPTGLVRFEYPAASADVSAN